MNWTKLFQILKETRKKRRVQSSTKRSAAQSNIHLWHSGLHLFQALSSAMKFLSDYKDKTKQFERDRRLVRGAILVGLINRGSQGRIYKAEAQKRDRTIAVKIIDYFDEHNEDHTIQEAKAHYSLSHQNIVKLFKYYTSDNSLVMHMEYFHGVNLAELISTGKPVEKNEAKRITEEVISALRYVHGKNITHNEVHEGNVMINSKGDVKLVDFGSASFKSSSKSIDLHNASALFEYLNPPKRTWTSKR